MQDEDYNSDVEIRNMYEVMTDVFRDLALLNRIEADPDLSQATLAEDLGVAIGTVNGYLQRMVESGYIKVNRARRRKLRYIITPEGLALRIRLTEAYIQQSFYLYRQVRQRVKDLLTELDHTGPQVVHLVGEGDIAEVCRLTCLEHGVVITDQNNVPVLVVDGLDIRLEKK